MKVIYFSNLHPKLPVSITGIGLDFPQPEIRREEGLEEDQWLENAEGSGMLYVGDAAYPIEGQTGFLLPKGLPHRYCPVTKNWTVHWVTFRGDGVRPYLDALHLEPFLLCRESVLPHLKRAALQEDALDGGAGNSAILIEILCQLAKGGERGMLAPAIAYLHKHYREDILLSDLVKVMHLSPQHLCKLFRKYTGSRPFSYLAKLRISKSRELMQCDRSLTIQQLAEAVGYHSYPYFIRVFKSLEGISPGEYRKHFLS